MKVTIHYNDPQRDAEQIFRVIETSTLPNNGGNEHTNDALVIWEDRPNDDPIRHTRNMNEVTQITHR